MPKSAYQHDRDRIATNALRAAFPDHWHYKSPRDVDSGKEYSEDWIIEIVNDDAKHTVTGIEFGIQNKTDVNIRKQYISVALDIDDVERLLDLPRPILIHGHDITNNTSYWLWLNEWYETNHDKFIHAKRKGQKQIVLKISKKNILDARAVEKISAYLIWEDRKRKIKKKASVVARQYPKDYAVQVVEGPFSITTIVDPKHEAAVPVIEALDESASNAMIRAIETGEPVALGGNFALSNLPELILEDWGENLQGVWLFPLISQDEDSHLKIEFLDFDDNVIFKTSYVSMRLVQPGTVIKVWRGQDIQNHVTYTITFDFKEGKTDYNIVFENQSQNVRELRDYFKLLDAVHPVSRLRITNLQTEKVAEQKSPTNSTRAYTLQEQAVRRMAYALASINEILNISLQIPNHFTGEQLDQAEYIAKVLREGAVKVNGAEIVPEGMVLICGDPASGARQLLNDFEREGTIGVHLLRSTENMNMEFLGQMFELGPAHWSFGNLKIINIEELKAVLANPETTDDSSVTTVLDVDRDEVYLKFINWPQKTSDSSSNEK